MQNWYQSKRSRCLDICVCVGISCQNNRTRPSRRVFEPLRQLLNSCPTPLSVNPITCSSLATCKYPLHMRYSASVPPWICVFMEECVSVGDLKVPRTQPACLDPFALLSQTFTPPMKLQRREAGRADTLTHLAPVSQQQINIISHTSSIGGAEVLELMGKADFYSFMSLLFFFSI